MMIRSDVEWKAIAKCVNEGIDSHLEAITERSTLNSSIGECVIHPEELHVLLRRMIETEGEFDPFGEVMSLRTDILCTLGIEEI